MRDATKTKGHLDFLDFAPIVWQINDITICLVAVYLATSVGFKGVNFQKLALLGSFIQSLDIAWVIFGDWNVTPSKLMEPGWPTMIGGVPVVPADVQCICALRSGSMIDYGIAPPRARWMIPSTTAD
eukprot:3973737-Pyramimonas_sp.AAC.1